jgi:hypothetical protein
MLYRCSATPTFYSSSNPPPTPPHTQVHPKFITSSSKFHHKFINKFISSIEQQIHLTNSSHNSQHLFAHHNKFHRQTNHSPNTSAKKSCLPHALPGVPHTCARPSSGLAARLWPAPPGRASVPPCCWCPALVPPHLASLLQAGGPAPGRNGAGAC